MVIRQGPKRAFKPKCKGYGKAHQQGTVGENTPKREKTTMHHRGKRSGNHVKVGKTCFNYGKIGHFTDDCTELNKVLSNYFSRFLCYVSS